jgi:hypothetical protein
MICFRSKEKMVTFEDDYKPARPRVEATEDNIQM